VDFTFSFGKDTVGSLPEHEEHIMAPVYKALSSLNSLTSSLCHKRDLDPILRAVITGAEGVDTRDVRSAESSRDLWSFATLQMLQAHHLKVLLFRCRKGSDLRFCILYDDPMHVSPTCPVRVLLYAVFISQHHSIKRTSGGASTFYVPKPHHIDNLLSLPRLQISHAASLLGTLSSHPRSTRTSKRNRSHHM
jgi:hypothetical protein